MNRIVFLLVVASTTLCVTSAAGATVPIKAADHVQAHVGRLAGRAAAAHAHARAPRQTERLGAGPAVQRSPPRLGRLSTIARSLRDGDIGTALALTDRLIRRILALGRAWLSDAAHGDGRDV